MNEKFEDIILELVLNNAPDNFNMLIAEAIRELYDPNFNQDGKITRLRKNSYKIARINYDELKVEALPDADSRKKMLIKELLGKCSTNKIQHICEFLHNKYDPDKNE